VTEHDKFITHGEARERADALAASVRDRAAGLAVDNHREFVTRDQVDTIVDRVAESTRREFAASITTVQVQIGATEKTLGDKLSSVKAWGVAALVGGQVAAGLVTAYVGPKAAVQTGLRIVHFFS
jgi:hypothetical protein